MDTKKERTADRRRFTRMKKHIGVRRVGVLAIRGALPRLRGRRGDGAWADWRPERTE